MTIGSLFSGVAGLELGLEAAGLGPVVWQVEVDPFCIGILERRYPHARRHHDIRSIAARWLPYVDVICGGFPCQDLSSAGARAGLAGSRSGLWSHFARIVRGVRPRWVVVENVASGASKWVDAVRSDLEREGYATLPLPVQADWLGAPYPRARVFIVARRLAHAHGNREPAFAFDAEVAITSPAMVVAGRKRQADDVDSAPARDELRRFRGAHGQGAGEHSLYRWREPMPAVDGMVSGATRRVAQRAAGNCAVPVMAEVAGWVIRELEAAA